MLMVANNAWGDKNDHKSRENRLKVLRAVIQGKREKVEIAHATDLTRPTVNHHLNELQEDGIIELESKFNPDFDDKHGRSKGAYAVLSRSIKERESLEREGNKFNREMETFQATVPVFEPDLFISGNSHAFNFKPITPEQAARIEKTTIKIAKLIHKELPDLDGIKMNFITEDTKRK